MKTKSDSWYWEKTWSDFRRGDKYIQLKWDSGKAKALLYNQGVPETALAVYNALPLSVPVVQVAWSGDMVMSAEPFNIPSTKEENRTRLTRPGDLTWDPKFNELCFVYGTAEARLPSGPNTLVVYGMVEEGFEDLSRFCRVRRFEGLGIIHMSILT